MLDRSSPTRPGPRVALFAPCFVDQLRPHVAIAALAVLERLGLAVSVASDAACCGQPMANAGFERAGTPALRRFVAAHTHYDHVVVLSGSCAAHVRAHAPEAIPGGDAVAARTTEFCAFLHDHVGVDAVRSLGARCPKRVAIHIGCHGLRALGLATPSEIGRPPMNKVRALLETVDGVSFADPARPDECCGFGGTFAVRETAVSARMGHDRLDDYAAGRADAIVSTDVSCLMHLDGLARRTTRPLPTYHVAELLAGAVA